MRPYFHNSCVPQVHTWARGKIPPGAAGSGPARHARGDRGRCPGHTHGPEHLCPGPRRRAARHGSASRPAESSSSLPPFSPEGNVLLWGPTAFSSSCRSRVEVGAVPSTPLRPVSSFASDNTGSQSWGRDGGHEAAPSLCAPFPDEKQTWPHLRRLLGQEESGKSERLSARGPLKNPALRGPGSSISPQPWL